MPFAGVAFHDLTAAARQRAGTWSAGIPGGRGPLGRLAVLVTSVLLAIPVLALLLLLLALGLALAIVVGVGLWLRTVWLGLTARLRQARGIDEAGRENVRVIRRP